MSEPEVPTEIEQALRGQGLMARRFVLISPPDAFKRGRFSYRVELEGGPTLKARRFETGEAAHANFEIRSELDEAFGAAIAWQGPVLLEAWIDGVPLEGPSVEARVEEAGTILGRLHAQVLATPAPAIGTAAWRDRALERLQVLGRAGLLAPHEVARLGDALRRHDPGDDLGDAGPP